MVYQDLNELISKRAYEIWQMEGCPEGRSRIHWVRAEAEIREKFQSPKVVAASRLQHDYDVPLNEAGVPRFSAMGHHASSSVHHGRH